VLLEWCGTGVGGARHGQSRKKTLGPSEKKRNQGKDWTLWGGGLMGKNLKKEAAKKYRGGSLVCGGGG